MPSSPIQTKAPRATPPTSRVSTPNRPAWPSVSSARRAGASFTGTVPSFTPMTASEGGTGSATFRQLPAPHSLPPWWRAAAGIEIGRSAA